MGAQMIVDDTTSWNGFENSLFNNSSSQLGQDIDQLEHLDRLEDIELTVNVHSRSDLYQKLVRRKNYWSLEQILCYQSDHPILKKYFSIPKGQRLAIVGKNGAGEINFAKAICGLIFITTEGATLLEVKISSKRGQGTGRAECAYVQTPPQRFRAQILIVVQVCACGDIGRRY